MARSKEVWLRIIYQLVPEWLHPLEPHWGGLAAALALADQFNDDALFSSLIGFGEDIWLRLHARGLGVLAAPGEADSQLRIRMREVEDTVTIPAILDAVNALLADYTEEDAELYEHWNSGFYVGHDYVGHGRIRDRHNAFTLVLPDIAGADVPLGHFLVGPEHATDPTAAYLDRDTYLTGVEVDEEAAAVYAAIIATVERLRADGVRWWAVYADS